MANPLKLLKLKPTGFQAIKELRIKAPSAKVWSALIDVGQWWRFDPDPAKAPKHSFEATAGKKWTATNSEGNSVFFGTVAYVEPGKLLRIVGQIGMTHLPVTTVLIFELQPKGAGKSTLLRLGQRSFGFIESDIKKRHKRMWNHLLPQLKELAEK